MITPAFELSQDPDFLTVTIRVPYARVSEFDIYYEGEDFKFYAKPYFLRLTLPGRIVEDGREKASYNAEEGIFTVQIPKETPGQHFEGLSMLTALLAQKKTRSAKPLVEEMGAPTDIPEEEEEFDWQIEQTPCEETAEDPINLQCYGFGNLRAGVFRHLQDELSDVIDLKNPDATSPTERRQKRLEAEDAKFDSDHYLADLFEDEAIQRLLMYKSWWVDTSCPCGKTLACEETRCQEHDKTVSFSEEEKQQLRKFTNKSYLLDKRSRRLVFLSLIDLLLAYCYEICVTEGEKNVESSWNIRKLSGTLSWLESYTCVQDVLVSFGRRVLCYPLYRHFSLVTKAIQNVTVLLQMGKAMVLKCLLDIHSIFRENDPAYILNDLYVTDYCIWIQRVKSIKLAALGKCLQTASLTKADLNFELEELETAARLVKEEEYAAKTASTVSRQLPPSAELETSDAEGSSSTSASETEESESDEEDSSKKEDVTINSSGRAPQESTTPYVDNSERSKTADTSQSTSVLGEAMEKLAERICTTVVLSEKPERLAVQDCSTLQEATKKSTAGFVQYAEKPNQGSCFLEVAPRKNPLLFVGNSDEEGSDVD